MPINSAVPSQVESQFPAELPVEPVVSIPAARRVRASSAGKSSCLRVDLQALHSPVLALPAFPYASLIEPSTNLELPAGDALPAGGATWRRSNSTNPAHVESREKVETVESAPQSPEENENENENENEEEEEGNEEEEEENESGN